MYIYFVTTNGTEYTPNEASGSVLVSSLTEAHAIINVLLTEKESC